MEVAFESSSCKMAAGVCKKLLRNFLQNYWSVSQSIIVAKFFLYIPRQILEQKV